MNVDVYASMTERGPSGWSRIVSRRETLIIELEDNVFYAENAGGSRRMNANPNMPIDDILHLAIDYFDIVEGVEKLEKALQELLQGG